MIKRTLRRRAYVAGLLWLLGAGGCKQALGDRCQLDTDCEDDLYCELAGNSVAMGGSCRSRNSTSLDMSAAPDLKPPPTPDLSDPRDLSILDGMADGGG